MTLTRLSWLRSSRKTSERKTAGFRLAGCIAKKRRIRNVGQFLIRRFSGFFSAAFGSHLDGVVAGFSGSDFLCRADLIAEDLSVADFPGVG